MTEEDLIKPAKKQLFWLRAEMIIHFSWLTWILSSMILAGYGMIGTIDEPTVTEWWHVVSAIAIFIILFASGLRIGGLKYRITGIKLFLMQFVQCNCQDYVQERENQLN